MQELMRHHISRAHFMVAIVRSQREVLLHFVKTGYEIIQALKIVQPQNDNAVYQYLIKKETEGKPLKVAKIAALNKFLRIYYSRVKEVYSNS